MRRLFVLLICVIISTLAAAAPSIKAPNPLLVQVQRLSELLRDGYAVWYPDATITRLVKEREGSELALVVFTVEGFGGGNNHTQYFAIFIPEIDAKGKRHFSLLDFMPIAGKGWRSVTNLNAKVTWNPKRDETLISFDGLEVTDDDALNFPSKKVTINLLLKGGRLEEQK